MDAAMAGAILEKLIPVGAFIAGLFADWVRQQMTHHSEERKHIRRVISDLLELRHMVLGLREAPRCLEGALPKEMRDEIPPGFWDAIDLRKILSLDVGLEDRYRTAVDEIAGYDPILAFKLRGKERYFDIRRIVMQIGGDATGSSNFGGQMNSLLETQYIPILEKTILQVSASQGHLLRRKVTRILRQQITGQERAELEELGKKIVEQIHQAMAAQLTTSKGPDPAQGR